MELIRQDDEYDKKKLLFLVICNVLSLLSLINLNVYAIIIRVCALKFNLLACYK